MNKAPGPFTGLRGAAGRLARPLGVAALGVVGAFGHVAATEGWQTRAPHMQADATRAQLLNLLGRYVPQGAPSEADILRSTTVEEGRIPLAGQPELADYLEGRDMIVVNGERYCLQILEDEEGRQFYAIRSLKGGALCVASDTEGGQEAALAALARFARESVQDGGASAPLAAL